MKLIFFGYKRHGKDTACEYLEERYGLRFTASSMFACKTFLFDQVKDRLGYQTIQECFHDRVNHRKLWYEAIRDYNAEDRARLGKAIFSSNAVYCGIRDYEEFYCLKQGQHFDLAVWVDASKRHPPEDRESMNLSMDDADLVVDNNGTLMQLEANLDALMGQLGIKKIGLAL